MLTFRSDYLWHSRGWLHFEHCHRISWVLWSHHWKLSVPPTTESRRAWLNLSSVWPSFRQELRIQWTELAYHAHRWCSVSFVSHGWNHSTRWRISYHYRSHRWNPQSSISPTISQLLRFPPRYPHHPSPGLSSWRCWWSGSKFSISLP